MTEPLSEADKLKLYAGLLDGLRLLVAAAPWDFEDGCPACKRERGGGHTPTCLLWDSIQYAAAVLKQREAVRLEQTPLIVVPGASLPRPSFAERTATQRAADDEREDTIAYSTLPVISTPQPDTTSEPPTDLGGGSFSGGGATGEW